MGIKRFVLGHRFQKCRLDSLFQPYPYNVRKNKDNIL
jgi:hypothetical protein